MIRTLTALTLVLALLAAAPVKACDDEHESSGSKSSEKIKDAKDGDSGE